MKAEPLSQQALAHAMHFLQRAKHRISLWLDPDTLAHLRPQVRFQAGILAAFALTASLLLGLTDFATRDVITMRLEDDLKANLEQVIPSELHDNDLLADSVVIDSADANIGASKTQVYLAKTQGKVSAVCFKFIAPDGYAGPINLVMGIDTKGEILGVRVISHVETPGLGDKIEITKSKWALSFNGKSLDNLTVEQWAVKKDGGIFDQFAGATITPRKVVQAIRRGLAFYRAHQAELISG